MTRDDLLQPGLNGAFVRDGFGALPAPVAPLYATLAGQRLAVKDVFDIERLTTGGGNPEWAALQPCATVTAPAVRLLLDHGAQWAGKTVTDELTYSLAGINAHYGTPRNPADAGRLPGGSSSGSAVAVAAGHADIGLGTDCGGSIRLPASYCGIWGMRPTHGRIAPNGCVTLAHSFDTVGWFARDGALLADVFSVLAHSTPQPVSTDAQLYVPEVVLPLLHEAVNTAFGRTIEALSDGFALKLLPAGLRPDAWAQAFRVLQAAEVAQQHGRWAHDHIGSFGADVRARMEAAVRVTAADVHAAQRVRVEAVRELARVFDRPDTYVLMPTLPWIAPRLDASRETVDEVRARSQQMLCMAGLAGLPQVNMPWTTFEGAPLGLSVMGARGADEGVLSIARAVHAMLAG
jgi:amidase